MPKPKSKVKKCQYLAAMGLFLCLIWLPNGAFAANYDLQPYTSCTLYDCKTVLDVGTLGLSAQKINNLKAVNITNFLYKSKNITGFSYAWNGNILTISGTITENTYWYFDAGTDRFDPWWNFTQTATLVYVTGDVNFDETLQVGTNITPLYAAVGITSVGVDVLVNSTNVLIYHQNGTMLTNTSLVGKVATLASTLWLDYGTSYYVVTSANGGHYTNRYKVAGGYPYTGDQLYSKNGAYYNAGWNFDNVKRGIANITTTRNVTNYYSANLYLNGNESNITLVNTTSLNVTAATNLTSVLVWQNGTLIGNTSGTYSNVSFMRAGLWNYTAFFGNVSVNATATWWATITAPAPPANLSLVINVDLNDAPKICTDNNTILRYTTINNQSINETYNCPNGCDNITLSCKPPKYEQTIWIVGIIGASLLGVAWIRRRM